MTLHQAKVVSAREDFQLQVTVPSLYGESIVPAVPVFHKDSGASVPGPGSVVWVTEAVGGGLVWLGIVVPLGADVDDLVGGRGRWEVVVSGVPAEVVTNSAEDDWLYTWIED